jgi:lysophospholipase L1-like esterase
MRLLFFPALAGIALFALSTSLSAQSPPNALLSMPETQLTVTRVIQLMESTAATVPGLAKASEALRQTTQATATALGKNPRETTLTLQFINELRGYLGLAEALPHPDFFPSTASQQFLELRDEQQHLDRHFQALLVREEVDSKAKEADPYNLKRYAAADSKELEPTPSLPRYVFLGDSATDLWRLNEYFQGKDFVNRGIAGQTTSQMLPRFLADVVALRPLAVIINAGSTDLAVGMTAISIDDNMVMMGDVAKAHSVQPLFTSVLPANGDAAKTRTPDAIKKLNTWIRDYCIRENFIYIDYYTALADSKGMMKAEYTDDGVNPNGRGYRMMAPILLDGVDRLHDMITASAPEDPSRPKRRILLPFSSTK